MKFILALVASCLFGCTVASGQTPTPTPPASGPVGPVGPAEPGPPPAKQPPAGTRRSKPGPSGPAQPGDLIAVMPQKVPPFDRWVAYDSPGGGFTVKFPAKPISHPGKPVSEAPGLTEYRTSLNAGANRFFEAVYFDFHGQLNAPELALEGGVSSLVNMLTSRGMEVQDRQSATIGRCPSREATIQSKAGTSFPVRVRIRILYSRDKVYALSVQTGIGPEDVAVADHFLDSFAVSGGCVPAVGSNNPPKVSNGTLEGILDPASGWQRFETDYGISFLLPTAASTESMEESALGKSYHKFGYLSVVNGVVFSVEIIDTLPLAPANSGVQANTVIDTMLYALRQNLEKQDLVLGACTPKSLGKVPGRECTVTHTSSDVRGKALVLVTPKWTFLLMAARQTESTDQSAEDRFFASVKIDPK